MHLWPLNRQTINLNSIRLDKFASFGPSGVLPLPLGVAVVSTIFGIICLAFFSCHMLFSQKGLSYGFEILQGVLSHNKNKILG
jgi:hypothetical protein